ncbi:hypothetical protein NQ318_016093 [Aromia moschata]|uniref:Mos1 transposase HTH domain-containing protein n=1 Tax=Aromia moschata TaxID=1265417 RepID=A0AAV8XJN1_9CUCU|nr:hypothetical protein NQ318_016093 [Aromia moschata]
MLSVQMKQRVNLKFLVKLGKTFTDAYAMLKEMYGNECTQVPAHKFFNGLNGLNRDVKRPKTTRAPEGPQRQKQTKTLKNCKSDGGAGPADRGTYSTAFTNRKVVWSGIEITKGRISKAKKLLL